MMTLFTGMAQVNYSEKVIDNINKEKSYIAALLGRIIMILSFFAVFKD